MAIVTSNSIEITGNGSYASRVNFEIPEQIENADGSTNQQALSKAIVTHYRSTYDLLQDGSKINLQFRTEKPYSIPLDQFLLGVSARLNMQPEQAFAIFHALIEELDSIV